MRMKLTTRGKEWKIIGIIIGVVFIIGIAVGFAFLNAPKEKSVWQTVDLTKDNLPTYLERFKPVHDIPEEGVIELAVGDEGYTISKGKVIRGAPADADVKLTLPVSSFEVIGQQGWCAGLQQARADGNLGIELHGSETELAWKYRSLFNYRRCLG